MNILVDNLINQRLKGNMLGMGNHAAYLFPAGQKKWCFKWHTELWGKPS